MGGRLMAVARGSSPSSIVIRHFFFFFSWRGRSDAASGRECLAGSRDKSPMGAARHAAATATAASTLPRARALLALARWQQAMIESFESPNQQARQAVRLAKRGTCYQNAHPAARHRRTPVCSCPLASPQLPARQSTAAGSPVSRQSLGHYSCGHLGAIAPSALSPRLPRTHALAVHVRKTPILPLPRNDNTRL